jgi:hypothetical protein
LVVTWTIPVPKGAKVTVIDDKHKHKDIFQTAAAATEKEISADVPKSLIEKLHTSALHDPTRIADSKGLVQWEKKFGIEMEKGPLDVFKDYFGTNHEVHGFLVIHPKVEKAALWKS